MSAQKLIINWLLIAFIVIDQIITIRSETILFVADVCTRHNLISIIIYWNCFGVAAFFMIVTHIYKENRAARNQSN